MRAGSDLDKERIVCERAVQEVFSENSISMKTIYTREDQAFSTVDRPHIVLRLHAGRSERKGLGDSGLIRRYPVFEIEMFYKKKETAATLGIFKLFAQKITEKLYSKSINDITFTGINSSKNDIAQGWVNESIYLTMMVDDFISVE